MKTLLINLSFLAMFFGCKIEKSRPDGLNTATIAAPMLYDFKMNSIDGQMIDLSHYKGKKILIVNTASACGYTPQYKDLETLHEQYGDKLVILGFPCNDFGGQEPSSNSDVKAFCDKNYGVQFTMFEKSHVVGKEQNEIYKWLTSKALNGWNDQAPTWNFCKYLINEKGELVKYFNSNVNPMSDEITGHL